MYIKELELENFKSFKGKSTLIFKNGFNVIFGQNGSGKSNIIDSILFILGETSKKEMRGESLTDFIYKGESSPGFAKVTIKIDNSDKRIKEYGNEIIITRLVNREGKTAYRINGSRATREQLINILSELKISNRINVIPQGKINEIVESQEEELVELIKSLSGISSFDSKKVKAEEELKKSIENISKIELIREEKVKQLKELEEESKKAENYEKDKEILSQIEFKILKLKQKDLEEVYSKVNANFTSLEEKEKEYRSNYEALEKEIENTDYNIKELEKRRKEEGGENYDRLEQSLRELENESVKVKFEIENKSNNLEESKMSLKNVINDLEINNKRFAENKSTAEKLREEIALLNEKRNSISSKLEEAKKTNKRREEITKELEEVNNNIIETQRLISSEKIILENFQKAQFIQSQIDSLINEKKNLESELSYFLKEERDLEDKLELVKAKLIYTPEEPNIVNILKKIPGVLDTVSNLMKVKNLDIAEAVVRAGGSRLNLVVVETEEVAKQAIEFIKSNKLGYVNFLPLNRIFDRKHVEIPKEEGVLGKAIDFIEYNPELRNVMEFVFGDTLVVKDFEVAKKLKNYRCVTLDGTIFENNGIISGGSSKEIDKKVDALMKKALIEDLQKQKNEIENKITKIKEEILLNNSKIKEIEARIESYNKELTSLKPFLNDANKLKEVKNIAELEKKRAELSEELSKLKEENVEVLENELNILSKEIASKTARLEELEKNLNSILLPYIRDLNKRKNDLEELISKLENELVALNKRNEVLLQEIEKRRKEIESVYSELGNIEKSLEELRLKKDDLSKELNKISKELNKINSDKEKIYKSKIELETKLNDIKENLSKFSFNIESFSESLDDLVKLKKEVEDRLSNYGKINELALDQYNKLQNEVREIDEELEKLKKEKENIEKIISEIENKRKDAFLATLQKLNETFNYLINFFLKGKGEIIPLEENNVVDGGLKIKISLPDKNVSSVRMLSGGEKSLVSLAIALSMAKVADVPFFVFDEVDAALDAENVTKLAELLKNVSAQRQIIMISHNDLVPKYATCLIGVAMVNGSSKITSISQDMFNKN
ncbi:MAG: chromosome segregation SMC family protein [Candidatus Rehaiarchaeum fermentans]|nr:chromosome segregation protein SMC [Candidatus Rehaiarchaeum fermentans]